jgi:hypothetical protein
MGYLIAGLLVLVIVAIAIALVLRAVRGHGRRGAAAAGDESYGGGRLGSATAILAPDPDSPLGDTSEHAGRQRDGETVAEQDAERSGGSGRARSSGYAGTGAIGDRSGRRGGDDTHSGPPVDGGEGEGSRKV